MKNNTENAKIKQEIEKLGKEFSKYNNSETSEYLDKDKGIYITQNNDFFKYGIDSFLLCDFFMDNSDIIKNIKKQLSKLKITDAIDTIEANKANKKNELISNIGKIRIADLCSGCGIIGIEIYIRLINIIDDNSNNIYETFVIDFFEKQTYQYFLNLKNVLNNNIYNSNVYNVDILDSENIKEYSNRYKYIVCNPPYFLKCSNLSSDSDEMKIAKSWDLDQYNMFFKSAYSLLENLGKLYIIARIENLFTIRNLAKENGLNLKLLQFVSGNMEKSPKLFLAMFQKGAKEGFKTLKNMYNSERKNIYGRK